MVSRKFQCIAGDSHLYFFNLAKSQELERLCDSFRWMIPKKIFEISFFEENAKRDSFETFIFH